MPSTDREVCRLFAAEMKVFLTDYAAERVTMPPPEFGSFTLRTNTGVAGERSATQLDGTSCGAFVLATAQYRGNEWPINFTGADATELRKLITVDITTDTDPWPEWRASRPANVESGGARPSYSGFIHRPSSAVGWPPSAGSASNAYSSSFSSRANIGWEPISVPAFGNGGGDRAATPPAAVSTAVWWLRPGALDMVAPPSTATLAARR